MERPQYTVNVILGLRWRNPGPGLESLKGFAGLHTEGFVRKRHALKITGLKCHTPG
jgi:hypothetical protein